MNEFTFIVHDFNYLSSDDLWEWVVNQTICEIKNIDMEPDEVIITPTDPESFDENTLNELQDHFIWYFNTF